MNRRLSPLVWTLLAFPGLTTIARADEVTDWNRAALDLIQVRAYSPPVASRALAMVSVAMSDAANAVDRRYAGYAYSGYALGADSRSAVARAACDVLGELFPGDKAMLESRYANGGYGAGGEVGSAAARAILDRRSGDGSSAVAGAYLGSDTPGMWRPTPGAFRPGLLPKWGEVTPFTMTTGSQFRPGPAPALTSERYARDLNEVKALGSANSTVRTAEETLIAGFWAAGSGTVTPPGMWNEIATSMLLSRPSGSLSESARTFALLNTTLADAAIACWDTKYTYEFWRPVSAIRDADRDGNPDTMVDAAWSSLLVTPNFPAYTSGHSTFSAAGATVLSSLFGGRTGFSVASTGVTREYGSFWQAAEEAGRSRIYGGIHYSFDNEAGLEMGRRIATNALNGGTTAPVPEPASLAALALGGLGLLRRRRIGRRSVVE